MRESPAWRIETMFDHLEETTMDDVRGCMSFGQPLAYGDATIQTMHGNEPGYAGFLLVSVRLPPEALAAAARGGVRLLADGGWGPIGDGESNPGLILFGRFKGDRPRLADGLIPAAK